jgi:hypothetical protein
VNRNSARKKCHFKEWPEGENDKNHFSTLVSRGIECFVDFEISLFFKVKDGDFLVRETTRNDEKQVHT